MKDIKTHSELSASGSHKWLNCPGSIKASRDIPPLPETPAAELGTEAHEYLELWLRKILKFKESNWKNLYLPELKNKPEMFEAVKIAVMHVLRNYEANEHEIFLEEKVTLSFINDDMSGTADVVIVEPYGNLRVIDYKHGKHRVSPYTENEDGRKSLNTQLVYYGLGAAFKYDFEFETVTLEIIQPRVSFKKPVKSITVTMKELRNYEEFFKRGVDRVYSKNPKFFMGDWCYFCPAREVSCPLQKEKKFEKVKEYFNN